VDDGQYSGVDVIASPIADWLDEVSADPIEFSDVDVVREARANQWSFSISPQLAKTLKVADIDAFLIALVDARERQLLDHHGGRRMIFYCWFDGQASQLRFSLVSACHGQIPFGCPWQCVDAPTPISEESLDDPYHGGIPLGEFVVAEKDPAAVKDDDAAGPSLRVWSVALPRGKVAEGTP
jgi:hypothetical protein